MLNVMRCSERLLLAIGGGAVLGNSPVAGLVNWSERTRGACPPPPEANTEHVWKGEQEVHWTYRLLRRIAFTSLAIVFWTWVIMLALSGRF